MGDKNKTKMNNNKNSFCIYCSEGASRVIKFYSRNENLKNYKPHKVVYDGQRDDVINKLYGLFGVDFIHFDNKVDIYDPKRVHNSTSRFLHKILDEFSIEYLLCFGDKILKQEFINSYPNKLINFHPAILPSFKGLKAINQALNSGTDFLGNTAHFIDDGIDTGKIIIQSAMLTEDFEDYEDVLEMQFPMIKMILRDVLNYQINDEDLMKELENRTKRMLIPQKCNF